MVLTDRSMKYGHKSKCLPVPTCLLSRLTNSLFWSLNTSIKYLDSTAVLKAGLKSRRPFFHFSTESETRVRHTENVHAVKKHRMLAWSESLPSYMKNELFCKGVTQTAKLLKANIVFKKKKVPVLLKHPSHHQNNQSILLGLPVCKNG